MPSPIGVKLNSYEIISSAMVGVMRRVASLQKKINDKIQDPRNRAWQIDIEGALAEKAFAKAKGLYWDCSVNRFKSLKGDVQNYEVRHTDLSDGCLIIRERDRDKKIYILIIGSAPSYQVMGWIKGKDAKIEEYKRNPNNREPAFFVPQSKLRDIKSMP